jgi:hypothetical protein
MIQRAPTDVRAGTSFEAASRRFRTRVGRDKRLQAKAARFGRAAKVAAERRSKKMTRLFWRPSDLIWGSSRGHDGGGNFGDQREPRLCPSAWTRSCARRSRYRAAIGGAPKFATEICNGWTFDVRWVAARRKCLDFRTVGDLQISYDGTRGP